MSEISLKGTRRFVKYIVNCLFVFSFISRVFHVKQEKAKGIIKEIHIDMGIKSGFVY